MHRSIILKSLPFLILASALALSGCGKSPSGQRLEEIATLVKFREYDKAMLVIKKGLEEEPSDKALLRQRILLFLRAERPDIALAAFKDFTEKVSPNDKVLIEALSHEEVAVRASAAKALSMEKDKRAMSALNKAVSDPQEMVRRAAVNALGQIREASSSAPLQKALSDTSWFVRGEAASALGSLGQKNAIPALFKALEDTDEYVRHAASSAIVDLVGVADKKIFADHLKQDRREVRLTAALALAALHDASGAGVLAAEVKDAPEARFRRRSIEALSSLGAKDSLGVIQSALSDKQAEVRMAAIAALARIPEKSSLALLAKVADDKTAPEVLRSAARQSAKAILESLNASAPQAK